MESAGKGTPVNVETILGAKGRSVETTSPDADMVLAVHKLATMHIGALVVVDHDRVVGTLSERDVVRALNRHGARALDQRVRDVMSTGTPICSPDDNVRQVMAEMTRSRQRHLPVVDADGRLRGVVSIGDVVKQRLEEMELEASVLRNAYLATH